MRFLRLWGRKRLRGRMDAPGRSDSSAQVLRNSRPEFRLPGACVTGIKPFTSLRYPWSKEPVERVPIERYGRPRPCEKGPSSAGKDERQRNFRRHTFHGRRYWWKHLSERALTAAGFHDNLSPNQKNVRKNRPIAGQTTKNETVRRKRFRWYIIENRISANWSEAPIATEYARSGDNNMPACKYEDVFRILHKKQKKADTPLGKGCLLLFVIHYLNNALQRYNSFQDSQTD